MSEVDRQKRVAVALGLLESGRADDALAMAIEAGKSSPRDPAMLVVAGRAHLARGDTLSAEAVLLEAARAEPKNPAPLRWLGESLLRRMQLPHAIRALERAASFDPADAAIAELLERARATERRKRTGETPPEEESVDERRRPEPPLGLEPSSPGTLEAPPRVPRVEAPTRDPAPGPSLEAQRAQQLEAQRLEAQRLEAQRLEAQRLEAQRLEAQRLDSQRLEAQRLEGQRLEAQRLEVARQEERRLEALRAESARLEAEQREARRLLEERREAEQLEVERLEALRVEARRLEALRIDAERLERERVATERANAERAAAETQLQEREAQLGAREALLAAREGASVERTQAQLEAESALAAQLSAERETLRREALRIEAEKLEARRREAERQKAEQVEAERLEALRRENERLLRERTAAREQADEDARLREREARIAEQEARLSALEARLTERVESEARLAERAEAEARRAERAASTAERAARLAERASAEPARTDPRGQPAAPLPRTMRTLTFGAAQAQMAEAPPAVVRLPPAIPTSSPSSSPTPTSPMVTAPSANVASDAHEVPARLDPPVEKSSRLPVVLAVAAVAALAAAAVIGWRLTTSAPDSNRVASDASQNDAWRAGLAGQPRVATATGDEAAPTRDEEGGAEHAGAEPAPVHPVDGDAEPAGDAARTEEAPSPPRSPEPLASAPSTARPPTARPPTAPRPSAPRRGRAASRERRREAEESTSSLAMDSEPDAASEEPGAEESVVLDGTELDAIEGLENIDGLVRAGRFDEARAALDALDPSARATPTARTSAARLALAQGRARDAVRELEPLVATEEASASVLALHARALLATGRVGAAARTYQDSMELDPNLPEALFGRAQMAVRARRGRTALYFLDRLDRALGTVPRPPAFVARARVLRGRALLADGHGADARRTLAEVIANDHAPSDAFFYFAESEIGHDHRAAREAYRHYLDLEPNGYYARRARHALQLDE